ncbi:MAG TPA: LacI family DNA-binding transcriptional regulator [Opitutaceae bacterium]|nr:LacI family DNA-binding transcriptional regulator [Opitutaceae bacterium]
MSIRKIAKLAGLSPAAVSLALRDSPKIPKETRKRVHKIAQQIGYRLDGKIAELMAHIRARKGNRNEGCFGVISLYETPHPWEQSEHLSRIYESARHRADELGYRLDPLWLRAPGMTYRRFRSVLDARGIQGLLCFGSPALDDHFPDELDHYAVVTVGLSIHTPLHRVTSHFYNDMTHALNKLYHLGYRRPGLVLGHYEDLRSAHAYSSAYLGWCERMLTGNNAIPVLRLDHVEEHPLVSWLNKHAPDVIVFVHLHDALEEFSALLRRRKIGVPDQVGVAAISHNLKGTDFSGMQQNPLLMGSWAVELLVSRIINEDFGIPSHPRIEMVESQWMDGTSLRHVFHR